jgi:FkbM family methyltransferase
MKFRDAIKLAFSPSKLLAKWELERVRKLPRYTPGQTRLFGKPLRYADSSSYYFMHEEIFTQKVYEFASSNPAPRIIDGGANIGLATIYFKKCFPRARVTAFEADHSIATILRANMAAQCISDIEVLEAAIWKERCEVSFTAEGADSGMIDLQNSTSRKVPALPLSQFLDEPIDFLKLDIEGAEFEVLSSCRSKLGSVQKAFIEYHSKAGKSQELPELLGLLKEAGFRCFLTSPSIFNPRPLLDYTSYNGLDMVLNIWCSRCLKNS